MGGGAVGSGSHESMRSCCIDSPDSEMNTGAQPIAPLSFCGVLDPRHETVAAYAWGLSLLN